MAKFMFLYTGGGRPSEPTAAKTQMDAWMAYYGRISASLADGGAPFLPHRWPLGGANASGATGFTPINASSLEDAVALTEGHPHLAYGGRGSTRMRRHVCDDENLRRGVKP